MEIKLKKKVKSNNFPPFPFLEWRAVLIKELRNAGGGGAWGRGRVKEHTWGNREKAGNLPYALPHIC
jgi:hypothetical protein